jgi:protein TonB
MSKPMRLRSASSSTFGPLTDDERQLLVWAFALSITLHAVSMLLPSPFQKPSAQEVARSILTARLEAPAPEPAPAPAKPEVVEEPAIKSKVEEPMKASITKPRPKPKPKERPVEKKPEPLAGQQLDEALAQLADKLLYPPDAIKQGLQGETVVLLDIGVGGQIMSAVVASSSGHAVLDQAALRAVRQVGSLSPTLAGRSILLPVRFRLL